MNDMHLIIIVLKVILNSAMIGPWTIDRFKERNILKSKQECFYDQKK